MSLRLTRRRFLEGTLALVCVGGGFVFWHRWQRPRKRIRDHFSYLQLERGTVRRFLREFEQANGPGIAETTDHSKLAMQFLLSTDFFQFDADESDADESRTIRYAALADPYANPCYNPLVRYV